MSLFSRYFGKNDNNTPDRGELVANAEIKHPLSLQVLFSETYSLESTRLTETFRAYHRSMSGARCEIDPALSQEGKVFGLVGWGAHVIRLVGFNLPMPANAVNACVAPSHYPQELKERARAHKSHVLLYYAGYESSPLEQYVALAATAGVLARHGALVALNESARTSFPAAALSGLDSDGDIFELLRTLPIPILYCGFVKYEVEGVPGVWMRTYGAPLLGLPDLAVHAKGHNEGQQYFDMFDSIYRYLQDSGAQLAAGHTMQIGPDDFLRCRLPSTEESFLEKEGELLVVEVIGPDEVKQ